MYKLLAVISLFIGTVVLLTCKFQLATEYKFYTLSIAGQNFNNPSEAHSRFCAPFNGDCDKCVSAQNVSISNRYSHLSLSLCQYVTIYIITVFTRPRRKMLFL